jgi:hypothetical protein
MGSRVEPFEAIRRDRRKVHRRAVRAGLASTLPPPREEYVARSRPATDPWADVIDAWLIADKDAPGRQRHTARLVWQRLVAEHGAVSFEVLTELDPSRTCRPHPSSFSRPTPPNRTLDRTSPVRACTISTRPEPVRTCTLVPINVMGTE